VFEQRPGWCTKNQFFPLIKVNTTARMPAHKVGVFVLS
jgi:hypothetical protein